MNRADARTAWPGLQAAIIDLDGTLVDTLDDFVVALNAMLRELTLPAVDRRFVERSVGKGSEYLLRRTLARSEPAQRVDALYPRARARYEHHYGTINGEYATVFPGVREGLDRLKSAGLRLACLTNKPGAFARPLLERKGLAPHFDFVFGGDAFERQKPDPLPLTMTCLALEIAPARALMVGDSSNDARAARAAGCPVVLVSYGYNHGEPVQAVDADAYVDRLDALPLR